MVAYSFKKRFVPMIRAGLYRPPSDEKLLRAARRLIEAAGSYEAAHAMVESAPDAVHPKRQTIRAIGKRRHARPGETLQLYTAMRTKQCEKIGDARCVSVSEIVIAFGKGPNDTIVSIDGAARYTGNALDDFARLDGFEDWDAMVQFWQAEHGIDRPFKGLLIQWEPI